MERKSGYHGRVNKLTRSQQAEARIAKTEGREVEKPNYWVRLSDVDQEVFGKIKEICSTVFNKPQDELQEITFSDFPEKMLKQGFADWFLLHQNHGPALDARRRIGSMGVIYVRFRVMDGSHQDENRLDKETENFQRLLDPYLVEKGIAVDIRDTF